MKKALLAFLLLAVVIHAPWRLMMLAAETMAVNPSETRFSVGNDKYWEVLVLEGRLMDMGWTIQYVDSIDFMGRAAQGLTDPDAHIIALDKHLSWDARMAILAHEGGHTLQRGWYNRAEGEIFAEAVATLVSHDGYREHARYMAQYRMSAMWLLLTDSRAIYRAARTLEDR